MKDRARGPVWCLDGCRSLFGLWPASSPGRSVIKVRLCAIGAPS